MEVYVVSPLTTCQFAHPPLFRNVTDVYHAPSVVRQSAFAPVYISWAFPPSGFIKINTDGSFMPKSGFAGFGGIARDDKGRWVGGFFGRMVMEVRSSLTVELWAIHGGLNLAKKYNLKNVIIETDSTNAVTLLSVRDAVDRHPDREVIEECRRLMSELRISIIHTLRQGNNCADHLAKMGRMQKEDLVILRLPPHSMYQLLLADMAHVAYPRYPKHVR